VRFTETLQWIMCDVCGETHSEGSHHTTGWLHIETMALGIVADTRQTRHLCIVCREDFDNFWGK
jgi:hypothetical protein